MKISALNSDNQLVSIRHKLQGEIILPDEEKYHEACSVWNARLIENPHL